MRLKNIISIAIYFDAEKYEIEILHLTNNLFAIFTIFGISKISSELFNKKVGRIVFLLCFFNPIFFPKIQCGKYV